MSSSQQSPPLFCVVMGVAGCGKSTLAGKMAQSLNLPFLEGDDFHTPASVAKMSEGIALTDEDRRGWLERLCQALQSHPNGAVLSCSALKKGYRDQLRSACTDLRFVHLQVTPELASTRLQARVNNHFFHPSLMSSQFAALEDPSLEPGVCTLDGNQAPERLCDQALESLTSTTSQVSKDKNRPSGIDNLVEKLLAVVLACIVLLIFSNVVGRYVLHSSFAGAEELARLLFVWLVFLGAILGLKRRAHLGVELVQARLPRSARRGCAIVTHVLTLYALWLFLSGSWTQTEIGLHTFSTVLGLPNALLASAGMVCAASMILIVANNLWRILANHPQAALAGDPQ